MKRLLCGILSVIMWIAVSGQQDSVYVNARISAHSNQIGVHQEIVWHNTTGTPLNKIKLLNWTAAYKNRNTPLLKRKLEDRKSDLYFAKPDELGSIENFSFRIGSSAPEKFLAESEMLYLPLTQNLQPGEKVRIELDYQLNLPKSNFTGYGFDGKQFLLKYFVIVPDGLETENQNPRHYIDIGENQTRGIYWTVNLDIPANWNVTSNLDENLPNYFQGKLTNDPEFLISQNKFHRMEIPVDGENIKIDFGYELTREESENLEFYLPLQLNFIKTKTGFLPKKIFISEKLKNAENFTGTDDVRFWKFKWELFTESQKTDLNYFSILSKYVVEQSFTFEKNKEHWMINGLKTYLEIQYIDRYYKDEKLLGKLPENFDIFGLKPLKLFHAADLKLSERYGLAYQYIMTQNMDQKISEPFDKLSNFNATAISHFEMGNIFFFIAEKMEHEKFEDFVRSYVEKNNGKPIDTKDFLDQLTLASSYSSEFLEKFIQQKNRTNFDLKRYKKNGDQFQVKIRKNTVQQIPFKVETQSKNGEKHEFWFDTDDSTEPKTYNIPQSDAEKIVVNNEYIFPENNFRDNYRYTRGLFANTKKIKFKLFKDIPNPEFNEIYLNPRVNFNAYDKILMGLNFRNSSLFERKFNYSFTPYFSTGTGKLTGSGGLSYSFQPAESFFRSLDLGLSGSYFHYDYSLSYRKFSAFAGMSFAKNPRSDIGRSLGISYNYFDKDLTPKMVAENEYSRYNLWNIGYGYSDRRLIHEKYFSTNFQFMEDFQKISAEAFYRWEFAKGKKISFRWFGGYFLTNHTKNNLFDYGISRVSNYAFSYGLLGQSATSGVLSQQIVIAEGGFKSYLGNSANQWITSFNVDSHVWRWFNVYADAGVYKSKSMDAKFIWDSGVKVKVIPDFLEVYFPVQSSLGFEPSFKDYQKRIRFTLVMNFSAITNYFRRGWF